MQTDHQEATQNDNNDNPQIPLSLNNKHYNSVTSVSSGYNTPKNLFNNRKDSLHLNQIQFINAFICTKNEAFEPVITQFSQSSTINNRRASLKKWYLLVNVVLPIVQMKKIKTHFTSAKTIEYLNAQSKKLTQAKAKDAAPKQQRSLEYIQSQLKLFDYIENGCLSRINEIQVAMSLNPKLINDYNYNKITPLYAACINGHLKIVELLFNNNVDHLLQCNDESVLDAAIRFSYVDIVSFLLQRCAWPEDYIKRSRLKAKSSDNKAIREKVLNWKKKKKKEVSLFKKCFCLS